MDKLSKEEKRTVNWMTLKQMSERHGIAESTLRIWKSSGYITSSTVDNVVMLDEESLTRFLNTHQTKGLSPGELEKLIKEKELERDVLLSKLDDELFLLKTHKQHQALFHVIIQELAALIMDRNKREVFLAISRGEPIARVAKRYRMTYEQALTAYNSILETLSENTERIATFRPQTIDRLFGKYNVENPANVHLKQVFKGHALTVLHLHARFNTVGELLQYTSLHGWRSLRRIKGLGNTTFIQIIKTLEEAHFVMQQEDGTIGMTPLLAKLLL